MKILVLGAGMVGVGVANHLRGIGADVSLVEESEHVAFNVKREHGLHVIVGSGVDAEVLQRAGAEEASHIISTMSFDEQNILACKISASVFNVKNKIARVRGAAFLKDDLFQFFLKENFGIDILIHPEKEIAQYIHTLASIKGAFDVVDFHPLVIVGIKCLEYTDVLNTPLVHFQSAVNIDLFVVTIFRNGVLFIPRGKDTLKVGDEVYIAVNRDNLFAALKVFGYDQSMQNIALIGCGNIGKYILDTFSEQQDQFNAVNLTIVEKSVERAEAIAQYYPHVSTVFGDALDCDCLASNCKWMDTVVLATGDEQVNVLSAMLLKDVGVHRVLSITSNMNYKKLLSPESGCSMVNPSSITIESIISNTRVGKLTTTVTLNREQVVLVRANVVPSCVCVGESLRCLSGDENIVPVCIIRDGEVLYPFLDVNVSIGDQVVMVAQKDNIKNVEKIFTVHGMLLE